MIALILFIIVNVYILMALSCHFNNIIAQHFKGNMNVATPQYISNLPLIIIFLYIPLAIIVVYELILNLSIIT